jgi:hypothetical protein
MTLDGPDLFEMRFDARRLTVVQPFRGTRACSTLPKLYVVCAGNKPIYVGTTRQRMRTRLYLGWSANGANGYHGYRWRHDFTAARLLVWYHTNALKSDTCRAVETVEAEVAYLIRRRGQWPRGQTEIHFHPSSAQHRRIARWVLHCAGR